MKRLPIILIAVFTFSLFSGLAPASAQTSGDDGFNITTSPLPVLLSAKPGNTVSTKLRVQNSGTTSTRFKVELKKFKAFGDQGKPVLLDRESGDEFFDWVTFSKTSFQAEPNVWNEITMTIKIPSNAAFGYYYAPIFSKDGPAPKNADGSSSLAGAAAILVLLNVDVPGAKKQLEVTSFTVSKKLYEYLPAELTIRVRNSGKVHLAPSGSIFITRGDRTKNVAVISVNSAGGNVLPGSSRTFNPAWEDGFPVFQTKRDQGQIMTDKSGKPIQELSWDFSKASKLRFGKYTAHMVLIYDDGTRDVPIEAEVSFWVIPWGLILLLLAIPIIPALIVYLIMRRRYNKRPKGAGHGRR